MPVDPIEGMARALCVSDIRRESACCGQCRDKTRQARAAWAYALSAMRAWEWTDIPDEEFLDAFAAGHRLGPPGGQECAPASEGPEMPSRPESATSGPARGATGPSAATTLPAGVPATAKDQA